MFFNFLLFLDFYEQFLISKNVTKLNKGINAIDFSSNIDHAKKSLAKVMDHRIEKLSTLLDANETQSHAGNLSGILIDRESPTSEASGNSSCSSSIKVESLIMPKSNKFKVNSSIRKHKCKTCNKRFPSQSHLNIHSRIHSKQKPFGCDQCQMAFSHKSNLTTHKRTHTGEKPYSCDVCPKKFAKSFNLTKHERIHTGEKPYSCDLCSKTFTTSSNLKSHKRIHT